MTLRQTRYDEWYALIAFSCLFLVWFPSPAWAQPRDFPQPPRPRSVIQCQPAFNCKGDLLALVLAVGRDQDEIVVVQRDQWRKTPLPDQAKYARAWALAWSPVANQFFVSRSECNDQQLTSRHFIVDLDQQSEWDIQHPRANLYNYGWSNDGRRLLFCLYQRRNNLSPDVKDERGVFFYDVNNREFTRELASLPVDGFDIGMGWDRTGEAFWVAEAVPSDDPKIKSSRWPSSLHRVRLSGESAPVLKLDGAVDYISPSPASDWLLVRRRRTHLSVIQTRTLRLTDIYIGSIDAAAWAPDGKSLIVHTPDELRRWRADRPDEGLHPVARSKGLSMPFFNRGDGSLWAVKSDRYIMRFDGKRWIAEYDPVRDRAPTDAEMASDAELSKNKPPIKGF